MTSCDHCGETSFYPSGPHTMGPCPLLKQEIDQRMRHAEVEHEARLAQIRETDVLALAREFARIARIANQPAT